MSKRTKHEMQEISLLDAVSDAFGEFQSLAEELGDVRDAMEDKLSQTQRFQTISDTLDTLESYVDEPDCPDEVETLVKDTKITVGQMVLTWKKSPTGLSRQMRFDNAISKLQVASEELDEMISNNEDAEDDDKLTDDQIGEVESYRDALQEVIDNLDGACEFPGMYG